MKKEYQKPEVEVVVLSSEDEVTSMSGGVLDGSTGLEDAGGVEWD